MTTGAVPSSPAATGEAILPSRDQGRQGAAESDKGGFLNLLSRLAGNREQAGGLSGSANEQVGRDADLNRILDLWHRYGEAAGEGETAGEQGQPLSAASGNTGGLTDIDLAALMQLLGDGGEHAPAPGLAAIAGRLAGGTETEADTALMRAAVAAQEDGAPSPEQRILATLAKAVSRSADEAGRETTTGTATVTVLRRETHLGPAQTALPRGGGGEWADAVMARGNPAGRADVLSGTPAARNRVSPSSAANALSDAGQAALASARPVLAAAGGAEPGAQWQQNNLPASSQQAEALVVAETDQSLAAARSDALVNTGLAAGVTQQIADGVREAIVAAPQAGRPEASSFVVKHQSPVKVLHIQLQPADLGVVTIRMTVKDNALRLDLEVGRGDTAQLIQRDRETLSSLLRSAGYLIDGVEIRVADQSASTSQNGANQAGMQMHGGGAQSGSSQAEARLPGERPHDGRRDTPFGNGRNREDEQTGHTPGRGGIYI